MNLIKRKRIITYWWRNVEGNEIPKEHLNELEEFSDEQMINLQLSDKETTNLHKIIRNYPGSTEYEGACDIKTVTIDTEHEEVGRFILPTPKDIIEVGLLFNDGMVNKNLTNIVAACTFILGRLYENGDITKKSKKEE